LGVGEEIISKHQMLLKRLASWRANIEVMGDILNWRKEGLPARNTEIALMDVPEFRKTVDRRRNLNGRCEKHIDIDDGFGREIWHSRTSNMFDCNHHAAARFGNPPAEKLEAFEPTGIVIRDDNRICHHWIKYIDDASSTDFRFKSSR